MKKFFPSSLIFFLTLIAVLELLALFVTAKEPELELVHRDSDRSLYVNTRTLVRPARGTVSFWNKVVPARGSAYFAETQDILEKAGKNPGRLEYFQALQEMDCAENRTKVLSVVFYDKQDRIILSRASSMPKGDVIAFEKAANSVWKAVCGDALQGKTGDEYRLARSGGIQGR